MQRVLSRVKRVTVQLSDSLHKRAKHYAVEEKISMNDLFVKAIEKYLEHLDENENYSSPDQ